MANQKRVEDGRLIRGPVVKKKATGPCSECAWYKRSSNFMGICHGHDDFPVKQPTDSCYKWMLHTEMREYINHLIMEIARLRNVEAAPNPNLDPDWAHMTDPPPGAIRTITTTGHTNDEGQMINGIDDELLADMLEDGRVRAEPQDLGEPELGDFDPELADPKFLDPNGDLFNAAEVEAAVADDYNA